MIQTRQSILSWRVLRAAVCIAGAIVGAGSTPVHADGSRPRPEAPARTSWEAAESLDLWRSPKQCGRNVTYMLLKLFDRGTDFRQLAVEIPILEGGSRLSDMAESIRKHGLSCRILNATPAALDHITLPAIAHCEEGKGTGHYVVLLQVSRDRVYLIDGSTARYSQIPRDEFHELWSGYLLVADTPNAAGIMSNVSAAAGAVTLLIAILARARRGRTTTLTEPTL